MCHNTITINNQRPCVLEGFNRSHRSLIPLAQVPQTLVFKGKSAFVHGQAPGVVVHWPRARPGARGGGPLPSCTARRQGWWSTAFVYGQAPGVVVHCLRVRPGARGPLPSCTARRQGWWSTAVPQPRMVLPQDLYDAFRQSL